MLSIQSLSYRQVILMFMTGLISLPVMAEEYQASIHWAQRAELGTLVKGIIREVYVNPGDRVKKNARLVALDSDVFAAQVKRASAGLESAKDNYKEAERERDRAQELHDRTLLSDHELQVAKNQLAQAKGELEKARALLVSKQYDLRYSTIRAPFNAIILKRNVQPGEILSTEFAQSPVVVVAAADYMLARFMVAEAELPMLKKGKQATVVVGAESFEGKVTAIGLEPEDKSATSYPVDVKFNTGKQVLRAGQSARVVFP